MGRTRELASAFVRLFVKKDELSAGLNSAKAEVSQAAQQMNQSGKQAAAGFEGIGKSLKNTTKPIREFLGGITSALNIFLRINAIIGIIGAGIGLLVAGMAKVSGYGQTFAKSLRESGEQAQRIMEILRNADASTRNQAIDKIKQEKDYNKLIDEQEKLINRVSLARELGAAKGSIIGNLFGDDDLQKVQKELRDVLDLITLANKAAEENQQKKDNEAAAKRVANFDQLVRDESAKAEKDAADEALKLREQQIEAARDAAREILDAAREEQEILEESAKIRERIHRDEMRRIEERAAAELRAINDARNQTLSAITAAQNALGQNNLAVSHLARIDRLVRMILERPIEKRL